MKTMKATFTTYLCADTKFETLRCKTLFYTKNFNQVPKLFLTALSFLAVFLFNNNTYAQSRCVSKDVKIQRAYLAIDDGLTATGIAINPYCDPGEEISGVALYLVLSTNASRDGAFISGQLEVGGVDQTPFANCFTANLTGTGTTLKVPVTVDWLCGQTVKLKNVFVSWGSNTGYCSTPNTTVNGAHPKCWKQADGEYITVEIPDVIAGFSAQEGNCESDGTRELTFTSNISDGTGPFQYLWTFHDGEISTDPNPTKGFISGDSYLVTLRVTDANDKETTVQHTIDVTACCELDVDPPASLNLGTFNCTNLNTIPSKTGTVAQLLSWYGINVGTNNCGTIMWEASDDDDPNTCGTNNQIITRTLRIWDNIGSGTTYNVDEESEVFEFTYTIDTDKTAPTWVTVANNLNRTVECSDAAGLTAAQALIPVASDNCDQSLSPVKTSGSFVAGSTCSQAGTYTNTWVVQDDCGNTSATYTQVITITDNTAPTLTGTPYAGIRGTNSCKANAATAAPFSAANAIQGYSDACGGTVTATLTNANITGDDCNWTVTYTFTVSDECGNAFTGRTYSNRGRDQTAPVISVTGYTGNLGWNPTPAQIDAAFGTASAMDNCEGTIPVNRIEQTDDQVTTSGCQRSQIRRWNVKDECNNAATEVTRTVSWFASPSNTCYTADLLSSSYSSSTNKTTFRIKICATGSCAALSYVAFKTGVVAPVQSYGSTYYGCNGKAYKVVRPVSKGVNGIKFESTGEGIKNGQCDIFEFTLDENQTGRTIDVELKGGPKDKATTLVITPNCFNPNANATCGNLITTRNADATISIKENATSSISVSAFPNPYTHSVRFMINNPVSGQGSLEVFNTLGQKVKTIHSGYFAAGSQSFEMSVPAAHRSTLIYVLTLNGKQYTGKLLNAGK